MVASLKVVTDRTSDNMDKQKALDAALAQIDRAFGKGSAMKLGSREKVEMETVSTGSLGLDIALGIGGLPRGRIVEKSGAWFSYDSTRIGQGRENAKTYLKENPEMGQRLERAIRGKTDEVAEALMAGPSPDDDI